MNVLLGVTAALTVLWVLRFPQVRVALAVIAGAGAALAMARGYALPMLGGAALLVTAVAAPVLFLERFIVPREACP